MYACVFLEKSVALEFEVKRKSLDYLAPNSSVHWNLYLADVAASSKPQKFSARGKRSPVALIHTDLEDF